MHKSLCGRGCPAFWDRCRDRRLRLPSVRATYRAAARSRTPFLGLFGRRTQSRFRKSCGSDQSAEEEHDGGGVEEGAGRGDGGLEVLCQSPVAVDPGEEALHDPAARLDGEADLIGAFAHDLDGDHGGRDIGGRSRYGGRSWTGSPASSTRSWRRTRIRTCRASSGTRRIGFSSVCGTSTGFPAATRSRPCENSGWQGIPSDSWRC